MMAPSFLLDGMLGSLARWLRILGYDTIYHIDMDDDLLRDEARITERVLVTRDAELYRKAETSGIDVVLIQSEHTTEQLRELVASKGLTLIPMNTRCPRCNGGLEIIAKEKIDGRVPLESFNAFDEFWICSECEAIYWCGSHWTQIQETLSKITDSKSL